MGDFIYFTEEQKERANAVHIADILRRGMRKWSVPGMNGVGNGTGV